MAAGQGRGKLLGVVQMYVTGGSRRPIAAFHISTVCGGTVGKGVFAQFVPIDSVAAALAEVVHEAVFHVGLESPAPTLLAVHAGEEPAKELRSSAHARSGDCGLAPLRGGSRAPAAARVVVGAMVPPLCLWANSYGEMTRIEGYQTARICV